MQYVCGHLGNKITGITSPQLCFLNQSTSYPLEGAYYCITLLNLKNIRLWRASPAKWQQALSLLFLSVSLLPAEVFWIYHCNSGYMASKCSFTFFQLCLPKLQRQMFECQYRCLWGEFSYVRLFKSCTNTQSLCSLTLSPFRNYLGLSGADFLSSQLVNYS